MRIENATADFGFLTKGFLGEVYLNVDQFGDHASRVTLRMEIHQAAELIEALSKSLGDAYLQEKG